MAPSLTLTCPTARQLGDVHCGPSRLSDSGCSRSHCMIWFPPCLLRSSSGIFAKFTAILRASSRGRRSLAARAINHWLSFEARSHKNVIKPLSLASNFSKKPRAARLPSGLSTMQRIADVAANYLPRNSVPHGGLHFARRHRALVLKNGAVQGRQSLCRQTASHQHSSRGFSRVFLFLAPGIRICRPWAVSNQL